MISGLHIHALEISHGFFLYAKAMLSLLKKKGRHTHEHEKKTRLGERRGFEQCLRMFLDSHMMHARQLAQRVLDCKIFVAGKCVHSMLKEL
jgi:hypothetical protein